MGYAGAMASTEAPPTGRHEKAQPRRAQPPKFPGCKPVRLPRTEIERFEGRLEYWDTATETAYICEPATPYHERPTRLLTRLAGQIAGVRGSPIECYGSMDLLLRDAGGEPRRIMQADESVYLHPARARPGPAAMVVGADDFPDVVLEVDHTTDVHRGKLALYESWGFPEVWVEVPGRTVTEPAAPAPPGADDSCAGARSVPGGAREPGVSRLAGGRDSRGAERVGIVGPHQRGAAAGCRDARRARRHRPGRRPAVPGAAAPGVRAWPHGQVVRKATQRAVRKVARKATRKPARRAVRKATRKPARRWSVRFCGHGASKCRRGSTPLRRRLPRRPRRRC